MRRITEKLRSEKGETLAEILVAVLVAALGCLVAAVTLSAAFRLNLFAKESDQNYYGAVTETENGGPSGENLNVYITGEDGSVVEAETDRYGGGFTSYRLGESR